MFIGDPLPRPVSFWLRNLRQERMLQQLSSSSALETPRLERERTQVWNLFAGTLPILPRYFFGKARVSSFLGLIPRRLTDPFMSAPTKSTRISRESKPIPTIHWEIK